VPVSLRPPFGDIGRQHACALPAGTRNDKAAPSRDRQAPTDLLDRAEKNLDHEQASKRKPTIGRANQGRIPSSVVPGLGL
jgi:hypothetical protein